MLCEWRVTMTIQSVDGLGGRGAGRQSRPKVVLLSPPGDLGQIVLRSLSGLNARTLLVCEPRSSIRMSAHVSGTLLAAENVFDNGLAIAQAIEEEHRRDPIDVVLSSSVK